MVCIQSFRKRNPRKPDEKDKSWPVGICNFELNDEVRSLDNQKIFSMSVAKVYPMLIAKAERKGRTKEEVDEVCCWLTGYTPGQIAQQLARDVSYETFFNEAPQINPNSRLITGSVCGIRVESIEDPLMQKIRWLDKLVDELAKGRPLDKVLRNEAPSAKWKCPKCGRKFRNQDQDHYCGEKPKSIDEYIENQSEEFRNDLCFLRRILREALPDAEERISWNMPTYWKGHNILHFAACKKHIGFYPGPEAVTEFATELQGYHVDKGTIRIPYGKVDPELLSKIATWCNETGNHA